jgi:hypothetical protein
LEWKWRAFFTFQAVFLMILRFLVIDTDIFRKFAVAYSFSWCGDDARKRPKFDDITDSFAVGIWALVGLQGTALEFVFDIPTIKHRPR